MDSRITSGSIESKVFTETYWNNGKTTVGIISFRNGFEVVGTSSCVDRKNFDREIGVKLAREDAMRKAMAYEGYLLQEKLHQLEEKMRGN
jgi:hypothetical protein